MDLNNFDILFKSLHDLNGAPVTIFIEKETKTRLVSLVQIKRIFYPSSNEVDIVAKEMGVKVEEVNRPKNSVERRIERMVTHPEEFSKDWRRLPHETINKLKEDLPIIAKLFPIENTTGELLMTQATALVLIADSTVPHNKAYVKKVIEQLTLDHDNCITRENLERITAYKRVSEKEEDLKIAIDDCGGKNPNLIIQTAIEAGYNMPIEMLYSNRGLDPKDSLFKKSPIEELGIRSESCFDLQLSLYTETPNTESEMQSVARRVGKQARYKCIENFGHGPEDFQQELEIEKIMRDFCDVFGLTEI